VRVGSLTSSLDFFEIVGPSQEPVLGFVVFQRNGRSVMGPYPFCCPLSASPFFAKESNCTTTLVWTLNHLCFYFNSLLRAVLTSQL
jgi:hypothetical protein